MEKALVGVKIVDLSRVQAGPSCAQLLGFLGADVIKVEDTTGGDSTRWELAARSDQDSVYYTIFNGNKRAMTLNLKTERGQQIFTRLVEWGDVVLENFSKGVMERLGFGYETTQGDQPTGDLRHDQGFRHMGAILRLQVVRDSCTGDSGTNGRYGLPGRTADVSRSRSWRLRKRGSTWRSVFWLRSDRETRPVRGRRSRCRCRTGC